MESSRGFSVESCSWDLTMGVAGNTFGKIFLRSTSASSSAMPEAIDHVGIVVYNRLYEYGHSGIVKSPVPRNGEDPIPQYAAFKLRKREFLGTTTKPRHEFVEWLVNVKYNEFKSSKYDMINHNCLDFCKAVCIFLGVTPNCNWERVSNWLRTNQRLADYLTRGFRFRNGRALSLQESVSSAGIAENSVPEEDVAVPSYSAATRNDTTVDNSSRRRRFSICNLISRTDRTRNVRSASMETLPPTYDEALQMSTTTNCRRDSVPKYEDL